MTDWRPSAAPAALRARADLLSQLRRFFTDRGVMEVETPLLGQFSVTDPGLEALSLEPPGEPPRFLQTSPEYAMKRLLAAGAGDIYQICKAFRAAEEGSRHNPEYTLLEWYRLGFDHHRLLREVAELICEVTGQNGWMIWPWEALFSEFLDVAVHRADGEELQRLARVQLGDVPNGLDRDQLLDLMMATCVEPRLAQWGLVFVVDYPESQAALARKIERGERRLGARFECYLNGIELANGYWECASADALRARFAEDNRIRQRRGLAPVDVDGRLLAAVSSDFPDCSGVALGVDRLLAAKLGVEDLAEVLAFPWRRA